MSDPLRQWSDQDILRQRPPKNQVDPRRPYAFLREWERTAAGRVEAVATVFLTNRECPFRCLMCDLWKNTTDTPVPRGAIPDQIDFALSRLPPVQHVKLYNSGNFFDHRAVPPEDHAPIAKRMTGFETVIVENHPCFCTDACVRFRDLLGTHLEIGIGLETAHRDILARLNKHMTLESFERAVGFLRRRHISVRAFVLLPPPFMDEQQGVDWAVRSMEYAFSVGVQCCSIIPTRAGNGIMERLQASGSFAPPTLSSMETVLEAGLRMRRGRVFIDLWDIEQFVRCPRCGPQRRERMHRMNLAQQVVPAIPCECEAAR